MLKLFRAFDFYCVPPAMKTEFFPNYGSIELAPRFVVAFSCHSIIPVKTASHSICKVASLRISNPGTFCTTLYQILSVFVAVLNIYFSIDITNKKWMNNLVLSIATEKVLVKDM